MQLVSVCQCLQEGNHVQYLRLIERRLIADLSVERRINEVNVSPILLWHVIEFFVRLLDLNPRLQTGKGFSRSFLSVGYTSGSHTVFHHRYHVVWITKYRYKVLEGALRERIRTIIRQVCRELGVQIVSGVLSREHVHMFVEIPPHIAVSDFVRRVKGRSSHRVQMEFPEIRKRYWGRHFWARGYFCTTSGNITDDVILQYLQGHEPTGVSR